MKRKRTIKLIIILLVLILILWLFWWLKFAKHYPRHINLSAKPDYYGVTFSKKFASQLGLDWRQAYTAILDDLGAKNIRLPIYWDDIEKVKGQYDFSDYDYLFAEGDKRGVSFIASIGWRLPRWPECHAPSWTNSLPTSDTQKEVLDMLKVTVEHYKVEPGIVYWQVENEPLLDTFGLCPHSDEDFLRQEVALVKSLDSRPIIVSASGELSSWRTESRIGDIFATTMYRVVWGPVTGYFRYPWPDWFYSLKANLANIDPSRRFVAELQAEPWVPNGTLADQPLLESYKSFDIEQFKANVQYADNVGFAKVYLWGVEWWYYNSLHGHPEYWQLAKTLF